VSPEKQGVSRRPGTFQPGKSGNPKGRPRLGNSLAECMREYEEGKDKGDTLTRKQRLVEKLHKSATGDNPVPAARLIMETLGLLDFEDRLNAFEKTLEEIKAAK
jgi:hypothetical protein